MRWEWLGWNETMQLDVMGIDWMGLGLDEMGLYWLGLDGRDFMGLYGSMFIAIVLYL